VKRRLGTLESRHEVLERNRGSAIGENGVKAKDSVEFVHASPPGRAVRAPALARQRRVRGASPARLTAPLLCFGFAPVWAAFGMLLQDLSDARMH
jgi:hypothetical protein